MAHVPTHEELLETAKELRDFADHVVLALEEFLKTKKVKDDQATEFPV